jgi:hypothetical protein
LVYMSNYKKTDPLPKPRSWPSRVGHSLSLKACLAIRIRKWCQENISLPYITEIAKKLLHLGG